MRIKVGSITQNHFLLISFMARTDEKVAATCELGIPFPLKEPKAINIS